MLFWTKHTLVNRDKVRLRALSVLCGLEDAGLSQVGQLLFLRYSPIDY